MKYEWRKQEKNLYGVKQTPIIVEVPKQKFILLKGKCKKEKAQRIV